MNLRLCSFFLILTIVAAVMVVPLPFSKTYAQNSTMGPPLVGLVNLAWVAKQSKAMQKANDQLKRFQTDFDTDYQNTFRELQSVDQELTRAKETLSQQQFEQRRTQFEDRFKQEDSRLRQKQLGIQKAYNSAVDQIEQKLLNIIMEVSRAKGLNMVLSKQAVVIAEPKYDISEEVLGRLNKELPTITVPRPF